MAIGIRREDKNVFERRTPLLPEHVKQLVASGIDVVVQPSKIRVANDAAYLTAGARLDEDLSGCSVVFAVKEIPAAVLRKDGIYVFFAHVIKGQTSNMPTLARLLDLDCSLIDYEKVTDESGRRLVFFGRHAGLAGMIDTLWALGQRLEWEGHQTAFASIRPTREYANLEQAKQAVEKAGQRFLREGLPAGIAPLVFGFAGYGNVSRGAQEVFDVLPHETLSPAELDTSRHMPAGNLYKVVFKEEHMVEPEQQGHPFELQEYYDHPERFRGTFTRHLRRLSVLMNCIYWTERYPRLVTRDALDEIWRGDKPRLKVIGDISCDIGGAVECTLECTKPDTPVYVYQVQEGSIRPGVAGDGPVVLAVDNLPCELPLESSHDFGDALMPFVADIARADFSRPLSDLKLPAPIKRALIVHRGELTPGYRYLQAHLPKKRCESKGE